MIKRLAPPSSRGSLMLAALFVIPLGLLFFLAFLTQLDVGNQALYRQELQARARLLAESAVEAWDGTPGGAAAAAGQLGEGRYLIEPAPPEEGAGAYVAVGEAEAVRVGVMCRIVLRPSSAGSALGRGAAGRFEPVRVDYRLASRLPPLPPGEHYVGVHPNAILQGHQDEKSLPAWQGTTPGLAPMPLPTTPSEPGYSSQSEFMVQQPQPGS